MAADLALFDPEQIGNQATLSAPFQYPVGMKWVLINGGIALNPSGLTEHRGGIALRKSSS